MKESMKFPLVLTLVCLGAALGVGGVYTLTRGRIAERNALTREEARKLVAPEGASSFEAVDEGGDVFTAKDAQGKMLGYVAGGEARGYNGPVMIMAGFDNELKVVRVAVTLHSETPGLGAELAKVKTNQTLWGLLGLDTSEVHCHCWLDQFRGMTGEDVDPAAGKVDAQTGATITSSAIAEAVFDAYQKVKQVVESSEKAGGTP